MVQPSTIRADHDLVTAAPDDSPEEWLETHVLDTRTTVAEFIRRRCAEHFRAPDTEILGETLAPFVARGKYIRSTFACLGWLCGRPESVGAAQAAASLELVHAFALIQDDIMDESATRRGAPTVHVQLARWAADKVDQPERFGRSAAVLLSDLCLVWAERMLREAELPREALDRAWPVFDLLRSELAVGQFSDLLNENWATTSLDAVLDVARRKSGNYSVRRPLELGAALAGCSPNVTAALCRYGSAIGEAFQLRDDLLGVFGDPAVTGKPLGDDLRQHKASTVIVAARDLSDDRQRRQLARLSGQRPAPGPDEDAWVAQWQELILDSGATQWAERAIASRVDDALVALANAPAIPPFPRRGLLLLADRCTSRSH
ncbi:polyprenyl synthetase family protein [Kribbella lupini]|uniref:Polyprenyl synthetase family protein n=1 Tax=Kribbella lupini TaxID=291602 RepID=A0ABP4LF71_9ACTN